MPSWVFGAAVVVLVGVGLALVVWLVRSELRERRKAQCLARLSEQYRNTRPASVAMESEDRGPAARPEGVPHRTVTVADLVARVEAEGLAVRLQWSEKDEGSDDDDWPTGVLPRVGWEDEESM